MSWDCCWAVSGPLAGPASAWKPFPPVSGAVRAVRCWRSCPTSRSRAIDFLAEVDNLILLGAKSPVSFFAYPGVSSVLQPKDCEVLSLAGPDDDIECCARDLVAAAGAAEAEPERQQPASSEPPAGELNAFSLAQSLAHLMPENAIVVDEGATTGLACYPLTETAAPHDWLTLTGGSIGFGLPCAVGAAIAAPERKVICLEGDGSAMYTIQALWTMARENLDITVVICNNLKYNILELEFARTGARGGQPGPKAAQMLQIGNPDMDFVDIARGMGVEAVRASTAEELNEALAAALAAPGPRLIDAVVPPIQLG